MDSNFKFYRNLAWCPWVNPILQGYKKNVQIFDEYKFARFVKDNLIKYFC
jgi:hypothetical protein